MNKKFQQNDSLSVSYILKATLEDIKRWIKAGNPPPKTQIKMIYLIIFLFIVGITLTTIWVCALLDIAFQNTFKSIYPIIFLSFITLYPALYGLWVSYCCWRKAYGYNWYMIPNFD